MVEGLAGHSASGVHGKVYASGVADDALRDGLERLHYDEVVRTLASLRVAGDECG